MQRGWRSPRNIIFLVVFIVAVWAASKINFSPLVGAKQQYFTLVQFFGPIAGGFLGPLVGLVTVVAATGINLLTSAKAVTLIDVLRLFTLGAAALYFGSKARKSAALIAIAATIVFLAHPVGRQVWFISLYWLIPLIAAMWKNNLFLRSLGATFTAHAVGSAIWAWTVPMTAEQWISIIPLIAVERLMFAAGIALSYVASTSLLAKVEQRLKADMLHIEQKYTWSNLPLIRKWYVKQ